MIGGTVLIGLVLIGYFVFVSDSAKNKPGTISAPPVPELVVRVPYDAHLDMERWVVDEVNNGLVLRLVDDNSRNPKLGVFAGDKQLGTFSAFEVFQPTFSPNKEMAIIRSVWVCGYQCIDTETYIANPKAGTLTFVISPRKENEYGGQDAEYEVGPVSWSDNENLRVVGSYVTQTTEGYIRISPQEMWNYNVASKSYSLIETLSE